LAREVRVIESDIPGPYNLLDLEEGQSVEITITRTQSGRFVREITVEGRIIRLEGEIYRCHLPPRETVFGAPYLDVLAGRAIATLKVWTREFGLPLKVKLTAHGKVPAKWYEITLIEALRGP